MTSAPSDQAARERFTREWGVNFAVVANAGSGKTTAISERLAAIALSAGGSEILRRTAVVTYTNKAAAQIAQRARSVLLARMVEAGRTDADALSRLERVFFGTIHSFCLVLARRHGSTLGIHLNPTAIEDGEERYWEEFLEQDPMVFTLLSDSQVRSFLRHASLEDVFTLARKLDHASALRLASGRPGAQAPSPSRAVLGEIQAAAPSRRGRGADALLRNKRTAAEWLERFERGTERLPVAAPEGKAAGILPLFRRYFAPLKQWMAEAGGVLAAELSLRYRAWRVDRGVQTYADQVETALSVLHDSSLLELIRGEGWRIILDEAQDTDPNQFAVLVEIARAPAAPLGGWPESGGGGPRPGHFCMVGDPQQGIYSDRADIRNFQRHVDAFASGNGGERLTFGVTFRSPRRVVQVLNETLPAAFGPAREHNVGVPPADGAPAPLLQVAYETLAPGPGNAEGAAWRLPIVAPQGPGKQPSVDRRLADEARQISRFLAAGGPASVGACNWGDICILAPRVPWLRIVRDELEAAGLKAALQMRGNRSGDNPAYAWLSGLVAVACDPANTFEWVGVLREVFAVSDAQIAQALAEQRELDWDDPQKYPGPIADALGVVRRFIDRADAEGESLASFASDLAADCALAAKARAADPDGGLADELARLLARAAELGQGGAGPRAWLADLLLHADDDRASGRPSPDAINLLSCHSAKGLEWPVVIPVGLWRQIRFKDENGLRLVPGAGGPRVVLDREGVGEAASTSMARGRLRELVRLLYVTLTRARSALIVPWTDGKNEAGGFAELWGLDPGALDPIPAVAAPASPPEALPAPAPPARYAWEDPDPGAIRAPAFPRRILPHELAQPKDVARSARHEASAEQALPVRDGADPLDYGLWWHDTMELVPWTGDPAALAAHGASSISRARAQGFGDRASEEWARLLASEPWGLIREGRWTRMAEAGIFAPVGDDGWIDGVMDLVLHDPGEREVWVVDWKTNRREPGESDDALLGRLADVYGSQLLAYGKGSRGFFPGCRLMLWVYSTVAGRWISVAERP